MSIRTNEGPQPAAPSRSADRNRIVASRWIHAFNARDDAAEVAAVLPTTSRTRPRRSATMRQDA